MGSSEKTGIAATGLLMVVSIITRLEVTVDALCPSELGRRLGEWPRLRLDPLTIKVRVGAGRRAAASDVIRIEWIGGA